MKKIISLLLVVCMMLPMALPVFAAESSKTFYGTINISRTNSMEWILATDGETQTFVKNFSDSYKIATDSESAARWLYFKVNVGHGWNFSETTSSTLKISFYRVYAGDVNVYVFPSDKNEWKKADNATAGGLTGDDKFAVPVLENAAASGTYTTSSNAYNKTCSVKLTAATLNECYNQDDGCLYMALGITATGSSAATFQKASGYAESNKCHSLTLYGTQDLGNPDISFDNAKSTVEIIGNNAVVTTTAGAGAAKLIVASYEGNKFFDVEIYDLDGAEGEDGKFTVDISETLSDTRKVRAFLWANDMITPLANVAEKNFKLKQETFSKANNPSSTYDTFCNMSEAAFIIPGLNQGIVPQGVAYREDTDQFYLSGYFKDGQSSAISVIDGKTGETVGEYFLKNEDGTAHAGHVGGIAVDGNNIYITNGCYVYTVSLESVDELGYTGDLYIEGKINLSIGDLSNENNRGCSYVDCSDGYLWVGNFYAAGDASYDTPISEEYPALVRGYKLDPTQPNGFAAEYKTQNTDVYDYIPEVMYNVSEERIQGGSVSGNYLILSRSSGSSASKLYVYDTTEPTAEATMLLDGDKEVPVKSLSTKKTVTALPYSEDLAIVGDKAYISFESGSPFFRTNSGAYPTDSVWKISLSKLLDIE